MQFKLITALLIAAFVSFVSPVMANINDATVFPPVTMQNQECGADQLRVLSWAKGASSTVCLTGQEVFKLAIPSCLANQQVVFDGSSYVCRTPVSIPTCMDGQYLSFDGTSYACKSTKAPPTCTASQVLSFNGTEYVCIERTNDIPVCGANQFLTFNGSTYQCASEQKLVLPVCGANQYLTSDGTSLSCVDFPVQKVTPPTINVVSASYGNNCGTSYGNVTGVVAGLCNGNATCSFVENNSLFGDPTYGCAKEFQMEYTCGNITKTAFQPAIPGEGYGVSISCP